MAERAPNRTRTVTWDDPMITAAWLGKASGLELLQRLMREGAAPPIARLLDFALVEVEDGRAVFEVKPQEFHYNPTGSVHGGLA